MVYRDEFFPCASCDAALELHGTGLVCTKCGGRLVTDLHSTLKAIWPGTQFNMRPVMFNNRHRSCPRCQTQMTLFIGQDLMAYRCPEHGWWIDGDLLARLSDPFWRSIRQALRRGSAR